MAISGYRSSKGMTESSWHPVVLINNSFDRFDVLIFKKNSQLVTTTGRAQLIRNVRITHYQKFVKKKIVIFIKTLNYNFIWIRLQFRCLFWINVLRVLLWFYFFESHVKNFELQLNANTLYSKTMDVLSTWSTSI